MAKSKRNIWDRWIEKGEGPKAHELAYAYFELGSARTLPLVSQKTGRSLSLVSQLSAEFQWVRRARAFDQHLRDIEQKAIEEQVRTDAILWVQREREYRQEGYQLSIDLLEKAKQMLAAPLYEQTVTKTQTIAGANGQSVEIPVTTVMKPVRWNYKTAADIIKLSDEIRRLSLGMPTSHSVVDVNWSDDPEVRYMRARAAMKVWLERDFQVLVDKILAAEPHRDPEQLKLELLAEAPNWFATDWQLPDPSRLMIEGFTAEEPEEGGGALPLPTDEHSNAVN